MSASGVARFFGALLMAVGALIAGSAGLCTLVFLSDSGGLSMLGVVPVAIGVGLFLGGRAVYRGLPDSPPARPPTLPPGLPPP